MTNVSTQTIAEIVVVLLGAQAIIKLAVLLAVPYKARRAALDRAYGSKPTATRVSDSVLIAVTILVFAVMLLRGLEPTSFLGGLWIGATLVQLYFHRFHQTLAPEQSPPPVASPIKTMSYAIQAEPMRAWREMLLLTVTIAWSVALIVKR